MSIYIYGNVPLERVKELGGVRCSLAFKNAIKGATLVYTDDSEVTANYAAVGVEVKPLTKQKSKRKTKVKED